MVRSEWPESKSAKFVNTVSTGNNQHCILKTDIWHYLEAFLYFIAGVFTLFIWWVWLLPRYSVAYAGFYEELKKEFKS